MSIASCDGAETLDSVTSHTTVAFSGTITGKAFVTITPPGKSARKLYINDMKVEVRKKDALGDTVVGAGATTEGGAFSISYSTDSSADAIELYLHFIAESESGMIRVRKKGLVDKWSRNQDVLKDTPLIVSASAPTVSPPDQGEIELDRTELKPQLLHWANRARTFVFEELDPSSPLPLFASTPLDILTPPIGLSAQSFFIPATRYDELLDLAALGLLPPPLNGLAIAFIETQFSDQDALYLSENQDDDDGTTMHEFGHYLMWYAQGKRWLNPIKASFAVHYTQTNSDNSMIAWTEGFADGFARIVDNWSFADNQEGDSDKASTPAIESLGPFGIPTCGAGSGTTCNGQPTSHGFFSEEYIDHVLYDLWDGPTNLTTGPGAANPTTVSYADDTVELTFSEIMEPILDTESGAESLITNIVDYHTRLYALQRDRAIKNLFVTDKIRNLHVTATTPLLVDLPNTDAISFVRDVEVERYDVAFTPNLTLLSSRGPVVEPFTVDVTTLLRSNDDYNLGLLAGTSMTLSDDLVIDGSAALGAAKLSFNSRTRPIGWRVAGNTYGAAAGILLPASTKLDVTIADGTTITAKDRGTLELGDAANGQRATVTVGPGATLRLGGGPGGDFPQLDPITNTQVSKGKVIIHQGSKLVIERGGTLVIDKGAEFFLDGPGAELIIRGDLQVLPDATFWWTATGGGLVTFDLENKGGDQNVNLMANAQILAEEVEFVIADNTYIRPPETWPSRITLRNAARGHFGANAYINGSHATVTLDDSVIDALGTSLHAGVILNGGPHLIRDMAFSGGLYCLRETQGGVPLLVTASTFTSCKTAIDTTAIGVGLVDVTITGGTVGVWTRTAPSVGITNSQILGAGTGWRLTNRGSGTQGITNTEIAATGTGVYVEGSFPAGAPAVALTDATISGGTYGVRSYGSTVRILRGTIQNSAVGVRMEGTALLDLSGGANVTFRGNDVSIGLLGAGTPRLDGGNVFYPKTNVTNGFTLQGTIANTAACTVAHTLRVTSDVWEVWNIGAAAYLAQSMTTSPYDVKSQSNCVYTLVN